MVCVCVNHWVKGRKIVQVEVEGMVLPLCQAFLLFSRRKQDFSTHLPFWQLPLWFSPLPSIDLSSHTDDRVPNLVEQSLEIPFDPQILVGMVTVLTFFMPSRSFSPCSLPLMDKQPTERSAFMGQTYLGISHSTSLPKLHEAYQLNKPWFPPSKLKYYIHHYVCKYILRIYNSVSILFHLPTCTFL